LKSALSSLGPTWIVVVAVCLREILSIVFVVVGQEAILQEVLVVMYWEPALAFLVMDALWLVPLEWEAVVEVVV
jgi:hypothetical protein